MHIALIPLLGLLLICAIAWWAINYLSLPPPIKMIIVVVVAVLCIIWVAHTFGLLEGTGISVSSLSPDARMLA